MRISDPKRRMFPIGVVADIIGISQKQLRIYESRGIIRPARSDGNRRLYSQKDVEVLTFVHYLVSVEKINLAGVKFILHLLDSLPLRQRERLILSVEKQLEHLSQPDRSAFESETACETDEPLLAEPTGETPVLEPADELKPVLQILKKA